MSAKVENLSTSSSGFFCDLCKLDFTTNEELKEHSWTILHHGKLNKARGRDCVHECSLCSETFVELLSFTKHLHGDVHQDRYDTWKKQQLNSQWKSRSYSPFNTSSVTQNDGMKKTVGNFTSGQNDNEYFMNFRGKPKTTWQNSRSRKNHHNQKSHPEPLMTMDFTNSDFFAPMEGSVNLKDHQNTSDFRIGSPSFDRPNIRNDRSRHTKRSERGPPRGKKQRNDAKPRKKSKSKRPNSRGSSFDNSLSSRDGDLSLNRERSLTPVLGVVTGTCTSDSIDIQTGKHNKNNSTSESIRNSTGKEARFSKSFKIPSRFKWVSPSYARSNEPNLNLSSKSFEGSFRNGPTSEDGGKWNSKGSGLNHSFEGNGADDNSLFTSTEMKGRGNGNPQDPKGEITSFFSNSEQSQAESTERETLLNKRCLPSTYTIGNDKDFEMTMDNSETTTSGFDSNKFSPTNVPRFDSNREKFKLKVNSRLRSRSSSDDTTFRSRHDVAYSTTDEVTQRKSLYLTTSTTSSTCTSRSLASNGSKSLQASTLNEAQIKPLSLNKDNPESSKPCEKNAYSGSDSKIAEEHQIPAGETSNTSCSFVHIDGVRCSAKTSERYCSYHKKFPQGNLIKTEQVDACTTSLSLDISMPSNTNKLSNLLDNDQRQSNIDTNDNVQMMDLSMSTKFLSVPRTQMLTQNHSVWSLPSGKSLRNDTEKSTRTSHSIINPISSLSENRESSRQTHLENSTFRLKTNDYKDEPVKIKEEPLSPTTPTIPSPSINAPYKEIITTVPTLDLSKLNLPLNVRRALAMKYSSKKKVENVSSSNTVAPNLNTARNRFVETKKDSSVPVERPIQPSVGIYQPPPPVGHLRAARLRQQRSISLDSYPSNIAPVPFDPSILGHGPLPISPGGPFSPFHAQSSAFSPFSVNAKQYEQTQMIDLNSSSYLPSRTSPQSKLPSRNQGLGTAEFEKQTMENVGKFSPRKQLPIPGLRTIRSMSTERESSYYNDNSCPVHSTLTENRKRCIVLGASSKPTNASDQLDHQLSSLPSKQDMLTKDNTNTLEPNPRNVLPEQREKQATTLALESHFKQSLAQKDRLFTSPNQPQNDETNTVNANRRNGSPRILQPSSSTTTVQHSTSHHGDVQTSGLTGDQPSKRKATELVEPDLKRKKGLENPSNKESVSYLPGFEVQELIRLEHEEQSKMRHLQDVQEKIKTTKLKLQALSIELESLQSQESAISKEMSHFKSKRLDILQEALHRNNNIVKTESQTDASPISYSSNVFTSANSTRSSTSVQNVHQVNNDYGSIGLKSNTEPGSNQLYSSPVKGLQNSKSPSDDHAMVINNRNISHNNNNEDVPTRDEQNIYTEDVEEHFEKSKNDFLNRLRQEIATPKKRPLKKPRKSFSEAKISNTIALSKDKLVLVRERMQGWKNHQDELESGNIEQPDINFTPETQPVRDTTDLLPGYDSTAKTTTTHVTCKTGSKQTKGKSKARLLVKKKQKDTKVNQKKKRKSSHPSKLDDQGRVNKHTDAKTIDGPKDNNDNPSDEHNKKHDGSSSGSQFHAAAVESLRKKLEKTNSAGKSKSLSMPKASASSFEGHTGAVCALKVQHKESLGSETAAIEGI